MVTIYLSTFIDLVYFVISYQKPKVLRADNPKWLNPLIRTIEIRWEIPLGLKGSTKLVRGVAQRAYRIPTEILYVIWDLF